MKNSRLVYSTEQGRICPACANTVANCNCGKPLPPIAASDGIVRISLETQGRKGKGVTLIKGLALDLAALNQLCKQLKTSCGSGGTIKAGVIEIQGDHRNTVMAVLQKLGRVVKQAGG